MKYSPIPLKLLCGEWVDLMLQKLPHSDGALCPTWEWVDLMLQKSPLRRCPSTGTDEI